MFSFGSNRVKIKDLIAILENLMVLDGCTELEMDPPPQVEVGDICFYGVKQRLETTEEVLERNGLKDRAEKEKLYTLLGRELGLS